MKWTDVKHPKCEVVLSTVAKSKNTLPHARLPPLSKMLNLLISSTELKYINTKPVIMQKHANITRQGRQPLKKITYYVKSKRPDTRSLRYVNTCIFM